MIVGTASWRMRSTTSLGNGAYPTRSPRQYTASTRCRLMSESTVSRAGRLPWMSLKSAMRITVHLLCPAVRRSDSWGTTTRSATSGNEGTSQRNRIVAAAAPTAWLTKNAGTSAGRIPANVSVAARAIVTAGFANDVDAVNQYAAVIYAATANATARGRRRAHPQITHINPNVA